MELKSQSNVGGIKTTSRPLANFHSNVWGDQFLVYFPPSCRTNEELIEELKEEVRRELNDVASDDYIFRLDLVDAIQRLGIEYLFQEEIDHALQHLYQDFQDYGKDNHDLRTIALSFRLFRQQGYNVSCNIFDKFKDNDNGFMVPDIQRIIGVLEFFEATHLRIHNEDILDQAYIFTRNYLESALPSIKNSIDAQLIRRALHQYSSRRGLPRVEARHYISVYEQYPGHRQGLLKLAKLDYNLLQSMYKRELSELNRWWKDLEVSTKLSYARDRLVETYFWVIGVYFEPEYSLARKILTKLQSIASLFDDTYDAYGTFEELQLFTEAIERWNIAYLDKLPDYMKIIYKALLEAFDEIEEEMIRQGKSYRINYGIEAMKIIARDYFDEIKWREEKYKPTTQEYMQLATKSCGYLSLIMISFIGMGDIATKEAFDWVSCRPDFVKATFAICRLTDDIVGHEFERQREHIPSSIECYTEEHKVSKNDAIYEFNNQIESAWKDINQGFIRPTEFPPPILYRILNHARVIEVIYSKGDWYTNVGPEMQTFIKQLLIDAVP